MVFNQVMYARLATADKHISTWVMSICVALMVTIVLVVTASVITRFFIFYPLHFAGGLSKYLMMWMAFLGVGLAIRANEHVMVDMFVKNLSADRQVKFKILVALLSSVLLIMIIYFGFVNALSAINSKDPFVFNVSMMIPYLSVPVGALYAFFQINISTYLSIANELANNAIGDNK